MKLYILYYIKHIYVDQEYGTIGILNYFDASIISLFAEAAFDFSQHLPGDYDVDVAPSYNPGENILMCSSRFYQTSCWILPIW